MFFFHSDLSGHWLWNLEGNYSLVLESDQDVPHRIGAQGIECRVLFVSGLIKISYDIIYNNIVSLFQMLSSLLHPPFIHRQYPHFLSRMHLLKEEVHVPILHHSQSQSQSNQNQRTVRLIQSTSNNLKYLV